jgi:RNA polymerase sigma-70 factor (ECF subfamily)
MMDPTQRRKLFEAEVLPHLDAMHRTASHFTRSPSDADDLVQDAVIKAWRFFESYERGTNIRAWLLKIVTNVFYSKHRRNTLEGNVHAMATVDPISDGWISASSMNAQREPERVAERPLLERSVAEALKDLPEDFRQVLVLVDVEGLTYREVAEAMNCPMGTVMSRLHRARRAVALKLGIVPEQSGADNEQDGAKVVEMNSFRRRKEA